MQRAHLFVSGKVQGVWFRHSTVQQAQALGLTGWVRNLPDGRVEAVAEGPRDALETWVAWCHQGPALARVDQVDVTWEGASGHFVEFVQK